MHSPLPHLNALRAFEASARLLSLTKAAEELHVTPSALSHQIRSLENFLGLPLFERRVRSIVLTRAGERLYPGLRIAFIHIREALEAVRREGGERNLVISTPPGFTAKWLAPRLHRFSSLHPQIDARVSSSIANANFVTDGVDVAVRNMPVNAAADPELIMEKLVDVTLVPVCSPRFLATHGPIRSPEALKELPIIHDELLSSRPGTRGWADWLRTAGVDGVDLSRGLRFSSADHALDATIEGAGVLLAHDILAYDELRTGRLVTPFDLTVASGRVYCFVCSRHRQEHPNVRAFRDWIRQEVAALDLSSVRGAKRKPRR